MASQYDHMFGPKKVSTVKDIKADKFINAMAKHMKRQGRFELPKWNDYVKTGVSKELSPANPDWLYVRAAALARHVYVRGNSGVGSFRKVYGSQQRRGTCTNHFRKASGGLIRYCFQQLAEMGLIEESENGGQVITPEGQREMDTVAVQCLEEDDEDDE